MRPLNKEKELITHCLHAQFSPTTGNKEKREEVLEREINWNTLFNMAAANRVVVPVWDYLQHGSFTMGTDRGIERLKAEYRHYTAFNVLLVNEVLKVISALRENSVPHILYKGSSIACLYPKPYLRQSHDIDIIVQEKDLLLVKCVLRTLGYQPILPEKDGRAYRLLSDVEYGEHIDKFHNYACSFYNGSMEVEIHWKLACANEPIQFSMQKIWEQHVFINHLNVDIPVLGDRDFILTTFFHHGLKNQGLHNGNWRQLRFVIDVAMVLKRFQFLNWSEIITVAKETGIKKSLLVGSELARRMMGSCLPEQIQEELEKDRSVRRIAAGISLILFEKKGPFDDLLLSVDQTINARDDVKYKIRRILVPNSDDKRWLKLPSWLNFIYYLIRPFRLFGKYGKAYLFQAFKY